MSSTGIRRSVWPTARGSSAAAPGGTALHPRELRGELLQQRLGVERRLRGLQRAPCRRATVSARRAGSTGFTR